MQGDATTPLWVEEEEEFANRRHLMGSGRILLQRMFMEGSDGSMWDRTL